MTKKSRLLFETIALFCISLFMFTVNVRHQEVIGFESRFYLFALEMWQQGFSWFPTTYFKPYPDYPVTSTVLIYGFAKIFGAMNKLVAGLPSAIAASIVIVMTYLIGALHNKRWGLLAVFFLFLTIIFLKSARSISLDIYTTMITACCFYLIYSADLYHRAHRLWWIFPFLVLGFIFRGPIGLIIPTGVVCSYYLIDKNLKKLFIVGTLAFFTLITCSILLLTLAYHVGGSAFMHDVLRMQVLGRINNHYLPFYFYFIDSLKNYALSYPVSLIVLFGFLITNHGREKNFLLKLFGWTLVILIGMSIPGDKKIRYVLPMVPALALIAAYPFMVSDREKFFGSVRWVLTSIFFYFPAIFMLCVEMIYFYVREHELAFAIYYFPVVFIFIALQMINFWIGYRYIVKTNIRDVLILLVAVLSFVIAEIMVIEPVELYFDRAHDFVVAVEAQRKEQQASLVFYKEKPDGLAIKYLINMPREDTPTFIENENDLLTFSQPTFFVTSQAYFEKIPNPIKSHLKIIANDVVGHVRIVIFIKE